VANPDDPQISPEPTGPVPTGPVAEPSLLDPNRVIARVNDQIITVRSLNAIYGATIRQLGEANEEQIRSILDRLTQDMISQALVLEAAKTLGVTITREELNAEIERVEKKLEKERDTTLEEDLEAQGIARWEWEMQLKRRLVTERITMLMLGRAAPVTPETRAIVDIFVRPMDVKDYYERNLDQFLVPEQAEIGAIYIRFSDFRDSAIGNVAARDRAREAAEETVKRLRDGADFTAEMKRFQDEPMEMFAKPFKRGVQQEPVDRFVWDPKTKVGEISDPIEFPSGFLVVKLKSRQEEGHVPFDEVRAGIREYLQRNRIMLAQVQIQAELLHGSVVQPRRHKMALKNQYESLIQRQLEILAM
jgi:hypothetical protein